MGTEAVAGFDFIMRASWMPDISPHHNIKEYQVIAGKVAGKSFLRAICHVYVIAFRLKIESETVTQSLLIIHHKYFLFFFHAAKLLIIGQMLS